MPTLAGTAAALNARDGKAARGGAWSATRHTACEVRQSGDLGVGPLAVRKILAILPDAKLPRIHPSEASVSDKIESENIKLKSWSGRGDRISSGIAMPQLARICKADVRNIDLRHLYDRFGWQAGRGVLCAGALYRTEAFMNMPDDQRCGSRIGQTIYIEHTGPVAVLADKLKAHNLHGSVDVLIWLLAHSVTVAVKFGKGKSDPDCERNNMVHSSQGSKTHVFEAGHEDEGLPFRRYNAGKHSKIWDAINKCSIYPNKFSFADHRAVMSKVLE